MIYDEYISRSQLRILIRFDRQIIHVTNFIGLSFYSLSSLVRLVEVIPH